MNNTAGKLLSISDAASYLGVSQATLRRWDDDGSFKATFRSPGGHRARTGARTRTTMTMTVTTTMTTMTTQASLKEKINFSTGIV